MAKMSRTQLKGIVKECLMEILLEGLDSRSAVNSLMESSQPTPRKKKKPQTTRRPALDSIQINSRIQEQVSNLTSDPIMGEIFADTARSGIQESTNQGNRVSHSDQVRQSGDTAAKQVAQSDPSDLFGDSAHNWADLAFSSK